MAWVVKYTGTFYNIAEHPIQVDILEEDYVGSPVYNLGRIQSCEIAQNWEDYHEAGMGTGCEVTIINNNEDWDYFEELMVCEEQEFMLRVTAQGTTEIFEGFLLTEVQEQEILPNAAIHLKASNYIKQLTGVKTIAAFTERSVTNVITYISHILARTGLLYPINVNCSLYETQMDSTYDGEKLMLDLYLHKHLFFSGEDKDQKLEYMSLLDTLNMICKPFNIYVYSYNQEWYVERYSDLFNLDDEDSDYVAKNFIVFSIVSTGEVTSRYDVIERGQRILFANEDFKYVDTSQTLQYGKGYKAINVNCVRHKDHNLINEYFTSATPFYMLQPLPYNQIEKWYYDSAGTLNYGDDWVQYMNPDGTPDGFYKGIACKFLVRGTPSGECTLNISYRRQLDEFEVEEMVTNEDHFVDFVRNLQSIVYLGLFMRGEDEDSVSNGYWRFQFNNTTREWECSMGWLGLKEYNTRIILGAQGEDDIYTPHKWFEYDKEEQYYYWPVETSITLNKTTTDISDFFTEDRVFELRLFAAEVRYEEDQDPGPGHDWAEWRHQVRSPLYHKIRVSVSDTEDDADDTEVSGEIDVDRFAELDVDIDLYNHEDHGAANVMWINSAVLPDIIDGDPTPVYPGDWLDARTEAESDRVLKLEEHFLEDIFQLHNKPRKKLVTTIRCDSYIMPFTFIQDVNITRDGVPIYMLLQSYTLDVNNMQYEIEAEEYVIDEGFKVIGGEIVTPLPEEEPSSEEESTSEEEVVYEERTIDDFSDVLLNRAIIPISYTRFRSGYVKYYDIAGHYHTRPRMDYTSHTSRKIFVLSTAALPTSVGGYIYTYFVIVSDFVPNGHRVTTFDSSDPDESVVCFYVTDARNEFEAPRHYVYRISVEHEVLENETYESYVFRTNYAYKCVLKRVADIGDD
jgi:hypothetical protein